MENAFIQNTLKKNNYKVPPIENQANQEIEFSYQNTNLVSIEWKSIFDAHISSMRHKHFSTCILKDITYLKHIQVDLSKQ